MKVLLSGLLVLGTVHAVATAVESCPPETFVRAATIATPTTPYQVISGDFNGDGHLDLLEAEQSQVTVFLGAGDGTFGPPIVSPGTYNPTSLATGYFDGDNHLDVAIGSSYGGLVVLLGNGDGSFQAPVAYLSGAYVYSVAVADLTGDGKTDIVAGASTPGLVLLPGVGDGSFGTPQVTSTATPPIGIAIADFDGDGHLDVAITQSTSIVSIYPGLGGGALGTPTEVKVGPNLGPIVAGDFNDDGIQDIAVGIDVYVGVLRGNGDGTFRAALEYRVGYPSGALQAADLNGDGEMDVAALRGFTYYTGNFGVVTPMLQQPDGSLAGGMSFLAGAGTASFAVGDFNEDTIPDVATADQNASTVSLLFGEPSGRLAAPTYFGLTEQPIGIGTGDFDGDGREDLVILNYDGTIQIARVLDGIITATPPVNGGYYQSAGLAVADFNGDQKLDVAIVSYSVVTILFGNGDGTFQAPVNVPISSGQRFIVAGDLNGDGAQDLAFFNFDPSNLPQISTLLNDGAGNFSPGPSTPLGHNISALVVGRFDPGPTLDLVATNGNCCGSQFDTVLFLEGNGDGSFQAPVEFPAGPGPTGLAVADFNADEAPDLIVANSNGSSVAILLNTGTGFGPPTLVAAGFPPYFVSAGDFNSDGKTDIFTSNGISASLLLGAGGGTFEAPVLYPAATINAMAAAYVGGMAPSIVMSSQESALELLFNAHRSIATLHSPSFLVNQPASLVASASGFGPLSYQWERNGMPLSDGGGISGSQTSMLTIDPATFADVASYSVSVTDSCGTTLSNAVALDVEFADVPASSPFHADILSIARAGITSGCGGSNYCPTSPVRRDQMAAFLLKSEHGAAYLPPPCSGVFADVPCPSTFANWIEQLAAESVTSGCGGSNYCPDSSVTRAQMAVFLLKTKNGPSYVPPPAAGIFGDVPVGSFAADFIEALYNQGISGGCQTSPLLYCPDNPVLRQQMATLLVRTFNLP